MKNNKDVDSLSHTTWRCQYHVVFAPKYRRMVIYGQIKKDIGQILRQLCEQKGIETIEAEVCPVLKLALLPLLLLLILAQWVGIFLTTFSTVLTNLLAGLFFFVALASWVMKLADGGEVLKMLIPLLAVVANRGMLCVIVLQNRPSLNLNDQQFSLHNI